MTISVQIVFLIFNGLSLFTSLVYDAKTPDLYPNNAHLKMGWAVTFIATAWFLMTFVNLHLARTERVKQRHAMTAKNMAEYDNLHNHRWSGDSTDHDSATLYSSPRSPSSDSIPHHKLETSDEEQGDDEDVQREDQGFLQNSSVDRFLSRKIPKISSGHALMAFKIVFTLIERTLPILGFVLIISGGVVYGGLFVSRQLQALIAERMLTLQNSAHD